MAKTMRDTGPLPQKGFTSSAPLCKPARHPLPLYIPAPKITSCAKIPEGIPASANDTCRPVSRVSISLRACAAAARSFSFLPSVLPRPPHRDERSSLIAESHRPAAPSESFQHPGMGRHSNERGKDFRFEGHSGPVKFGNFWWCVVVPAADPCVVAEVQFRERERDLDKCNKTGEAFPTRILRGCALGARSLQCWPVDGRWLSADNEGVIMVIRCKY